MRKCVMQKTVFGKYTETDRGCKNEVKNLPTWKVKKVMILLRVDTTDNWITHSMSMQSHSSTLALTPLAL